MIEIKNVIPDILYLFLGICDVLNNLLILEFRRMDGIEKATAKVRDITKLKHMKNIYMIHAR